MNEDCYNCHNKNGCQLGERLSAKIKEDAELFIPERFKDDIKGDTNIFDGNLRNLITSIFSNYRGFIFIMAAGIVVRMIADLIKDKRVDPAVVVMDEKGDYAISLYQAISVVRMSLPKRWLWQ